MAESPAERAARIQKALGAKTVNEALRDRAVRHALYLERVKSGVVAKILGLLEDEVWPDLYAKVDSRLHAINARAGYDSGTHATARLRDLRDGIRSIIQAGTTQAGKALKGELGDVAMAQAEWERAAVRASVPVEVEFVLPSPTMLRAIAATRPMDGRLLKDALRDFSANTLRRVDSEITKGIVLGEAVPKIVSRLRGTRANGYADGIIEVSRREAEAIVRTASGHVATHASEITFAENADIVKGAQWLATLDTKTCLRCGPLDGREFPLNEGPRPLLHFNCRCKMTPVLKSFRELGIDMDELPASTRASMNGEVADTVTYPEWLKGQPASVQDEALGPARGKLFRAGKVDVDGFVDDRRGRILRVNEVTTLLGNN